MVCPVCVIPFITGAMAVKTADSAADAAANSGDLNPTPWYKTQVFYISITFLFVFISIYFLWNRQRLKKKCTMCISPSSKQKYNHKFPREILGLMNLEQHEMVFHIHKFHLFLSKLCIQRELSGVEFVQEYS
jgi:hypothetical protein